MNSQIASLSPAQVNILDIMSFVKTPKAIDELRDALAEYFAKRVDEEVEELWNSGVLTKEKVEGFHQLHERTTYK